MFVKVGRYMKAIILAAGYATRLYPLTLTEPKSLLSIDGKYIIDYIVDEINTIKSIDMIYVISNHKFIDKFRAWVKHIQSDIPIKVLDDGSIDENDKLGAIGDIQFALKHEHINEDVLILVGDNLFTYKLKDAYDYFKNVNDNCVAGKELDDKESLKRFAVAQVDDDNRIVNLVEKPQEPPSNIAVYGTYFYKKETLELFDIYISRDNANDAPGYFLQWLYKLTNVYLYRFDGECYDIGTHAALEKISRLYEDG
jgi:glucose-1-phosphate thymidylyltransferase